MKRTMILVAAVIALLCAFTAAAETPGATAQNSKETERMSAIVRFIYLNLL